MLGNHFHVIINTKNRRNDHHSGGRPSVGKRRDTRYIATTGCVDGYLGYGHVFSILCCFDKAHSLERSFAVRDILLLEETQTCKVPTRMAPKYLTKKSAPLDATFH
jgi:hypothetical protein